MNSDINKSSLISKYIPITLNLQVDIKSIFDFDADIKLTNNIDYPKCSFGFQHYIHSLKKDSLVIKQFENKKKVYLVTNNFELDIDNYEDTISNKTKSFIGIKNKILSLDFYNLWEIMFMFDLFDNASIKSVHFVEDGSMIKSLINFRKKFNNPKDDKYNIIKTDKKINELDKTLISENEKDINISDIDKIKDKIDFITCGSAYTYYNDNENIIEQEYYKILLETIVNVIKIQKKGGSFICKFFETFTDVSAKFISILVSLYDKVFFIKPMISTPSTSEKFAVCVGFKFGDVSTILKKMEKILETYNKNNKMQICDLFTKYEINTHLKSRLIKLNQLTSNKMFKSIGEIVNFINSQDYYGDTYETYHNKQIDAANYWVDTFLPDPKNYKESKKKITDASFLTNKMNVDDSLALEKKLEL